MNNYNKLKNNLEQLKLNKISENIDSYIELINKKEKNIVDVLYELTTVQLNFKTESTKQALIRTAGFPYNKTFEDFDFTFQPSIDKETILELKNLRFINKKENILLIGSSGVGKTHLAISIGIECAKNRLSTYFITCYDLLQKLKKSKIENRLADKMKVYEKYSVLIIDEIRIPANRGRRVKLIISINK